MKKVKSLNFEDDMYPSSLSGLEYATNLETLNINYNEVSDLSPLKNLVNLKEVTGLENFVMETGEAKLTDGKYFELEYKAIDVDGKKRIDSSLAQGHKSVEVLYKSEYTNFSLYSLNFLQNK